MQKIKKATYRVKRFFCKMFGHTPERYVLPVSKSEYFLCKVCGDGVINLDN